jgi:hypothetical protein
MMLYRLTPPASVEWFALDGLRADELTKYDVDLDGLEWQVTTDRQFSQDLLRIALRHGMQSRRGLVVNAKHTVDLGRADQVRVNQQAIDELQAQIRTSRSGEFLERRNPGWAKHGQELGDRVRESSEWVAREANADLAEVLSAPVDPALAAHWERLGGALPDWPPTDDGAT